MLTSIYPDLVSSVITDAGAGAYELGIRFMCNRDAWLVGARIYRHNPANAGPFRVRLWSISADFLAYSPLATPAEVGWTALYFPVPQRVRAGVEYVVSYNSPGYFSYQGIGGGAPASIGPLVALAGRFNTTGGAFPATEHALNTYLIDPLVSLCPPRLPLSIGVAGAPPPGDPNEEVPAYAYSSLWGTVALPWSVPAGWDFLLTDVHFVTKIWGALIMPGDNDLAIVDTLRNSYFHVGPGLIDASTLNGIVSLNSPLVLKSGTPIQLSFQNSAPEQQNMTGSVKGWLVPADSWRGWTVGDAQ